MSSATTDRRQGLTGGTAIKAPVRCATTANITLSGLQTIDGITTVAGDRVLAKNQTDATTNGIYVADAGIWTRDLDFDGANDIRQGTLVRVNSGSVNSGGWFSVTTADTITIGSTSLTFARESFSAVTLVSFTATSGQTVFALSSAYQTGSNAVAVFVNGFRQRVTDDYLETDTTHITFNTGLLTGDQVDCYIGTALGNLNAATTAGNVTISDGGDYFVATSVEAALAELSQAITADNGDTSVTLTNSSSDRVQRWNTTLTANRTVTLSTTNAKESATFTIVRASGATGNFTLTVGSTLATLRAPGEWCQVRYDSGTAAWVLEKYGILPSAEVRASSADNGDTSASLTVSTSERTQRWATTFTAERTATLGTTAAYTGARFLIVRTESANGNFALIISAASSTLTRLAPGQWCLVEYSGTAWFVASLGNLREPNTNVIRIYDDFLGEEINGYIWQSLVGTDSGCKNAIVRSEQLRGIVRLTTGTSGATMATSGVQLCSRLNWQVNQGGLTCEFRLMIDNLVSAVFVGLTNQDSAVQIPIQGSGVGDAFTYNANDAVGVLYDSAMTTQKWWQVGNKGGVAASAQNSGFAPVASTMETWRIDLSVAGVATFYRNGTVVGTDMSAAVTTNVPLTPVVAAFALSNRNIDIDFIAVQAQR